MPIKHVSVAAASAGVASHGETKIKKNEPKIRKAAASNGAAISKHGVSRRQPLASA